MRFSFILITLFLVNAASADIYELNVTAYDYNTNNTINNVAVYFNTSLNTTDINGLASFYGNGTYVLNATKSGYHFFTTEGVLYSNNSRQIRLFPATSDGIFRDRLVDLTAGYGNVTVCFYYAENGRLHGCYTPDMNITTNENINYTMKVMVRKTDMLTNPETFSDSILRYAFPLAIILLILLIIYKAVVKK